MQDALQLPNTRTYGKYLDRWRDTCISLGSLIRHALIPQASVYASDNGERRLNCWTFNTYVAPSIGICTTSYRCLSRLGQHSIDRWLVGVMTNAISPDLSGGLAPETKNRDPDGHRNETIFGSNVDPENPAITLY